MVSLFWLRFCDYLNSENQADFIYAYLRYTVIPKAQVSYTGFEDNQIKVFSIGPCM